MWKRFFIFIAIITTSLFIFPVEFTFLPSGSNSKMILAGIGLVFAIFNLSIKADGKFGEDISSIVGLSLLVSFASVISVIYNETNDFTYATYIVSMLVWLSGAYISLLIIKRIHGLLSVEIVCNYLICVAVLQCISALMIDQIPSFKSIIDTYVTGFGIVETDSLNQSSRIYGIGAALDVAGSRFSCILVMIAFICANCANTKTKKYLPIYMVAFIFIAVVGNMIGRTTTVGVIISILYWLYVSRYYNRRYFNIGKLWKWITVSLLICIPIVMYFYETNAAIHNNIRFAFEGFFNYVEKGKWETNSNNILKNMVVWPDNVKTWIIGDGYLNNPSSDPYYVGPRWHGFYKGTDIGYLRFIFYFGLTGLSLFIAYFFNITKILRSRFERHKDLFLLLLFINLIVWFKVSTDVFMVFAPFLLISKEDDEKYYNEIALSEGEEIESNSFRDFVNNI